MISRRVRALHRGEVRDSRALPRVQVCRESIRASCFAAAWCLEGEPVPQIDKLTVKVGPSQLSQEEKNVAAEPIQKSSD
jgi:hypothetical protein